MWDKIDKSKMVQYKLKVELNPEVQKQIMVAQEASGEVIEPVAQKQSEIFQSVKNNLADKVLQDTRDKYEESKEKPDIARPYPKVTKNYMEDIKEQDSEQEAPHSVKSSPPQPQVIRAPATVASTDNVALTRKISEAQTLKYSL